MSATRQTACLASSIQKLATNARPIMSTNIFTIAAASQSQIYPFHQTRGYVADHKPFGDGSLSQGHSIDHNNVHPEDTGSQSVRGGLEARQKKDDQSHGASGDAATGQPQGHARGGKGNPEGIGMVDQVGSSTGSNRHFEEEKQKSKQ